MSGKTLLATLLASCGLSAAATATAGSVASGKPDLSAEDQTAGTASLEALVGAAHAEGAKEGRKAERERFGTVLTDEGTAGKLGLAISLLSTTDLSAETVISNLKAAPSAAETVTSLEPKPAAPGASAENGGQRQAKDPLTGADTIAEETPLVDTGAAQPPVDGMDEKAVADLWTGAIAAASPAIAKGSVWDGLTTGQPN